MRRLSWGVAIAALAMLSPSGLLAGDAETADQIAASLKQSGRMHGYSINVNVQDGTVWLGGSVKSQEQLNTALEIVQDTPGIEKIVNGIAVKGAVKQTSGGAPDYDAALSRSVVAANHATPMPLAASNYGADAAPRMAMHPHAIGPVPNGSAEMTQSAPSGAPIPAYVPATAGGGIAPAHFDHPNMPGYAWPSYAAYPNYAAVTYPRQYSPTAWPFIGPFYPYPQVPLGWRKVSLEWHNGWWMLDFHDGCGSYCHY